MPQVGGAWYPDTNPMLGVAQTVGAIQSNSLFPLRQQALQLSNTGQQIQNTTNQTALQGAYTTNLRQVIASVPPPTDPSDQPAYEQRVRAAVQRSAGALYPQQMADAWFGGVGMPGAPSINDLQQQAVMANGNPTEVAANIGTTRTINTGGKIQTVNTKVGPNGTTVTPATGGAASLDTTLTPSEEASGVGYIGADNAQHSIPMSAVRTPTGQPIPNVKAPDGTQITDANGAIVSGLRPGVEAQAQAAATGGVSQGLGIQGNIVNAALDSQQRRAQLGTVIGLSKQLSTGPNTQFWKSLGELASEYGIDPSKYGITLAGTGQAAGMEALDKIAWQVAQRQFQVLGGTGSNMQLDSAIHTSPSSTMTGQGIRNISGFLQGNEDAIQAEARALQKWNEMPAHQGHPESLVNFPNVWNSIYDPRAFQFKYEDAAGQKAILDGMSPKEQAEFKRRERLMTDMGYLQ